MITDATLVILPFFVIFVFKFKWLSALCVWFWLKYKIIDEDTEHCLSLNVWIIVIYHKGNSHCQIYVTFVLLVIYEKFLCVSINIVYE